MILLPDIRVDDAAHLDAAAQHWQQQANRWTDIHAHVALRGRRVGLVR
jgi:hypothetical protein